MLQYLWPELGAKTRWTVTRRWQNSHMSWRTLHQKLRRSRQCRLTHLCEFEWYEFLIGGLTSEWQLAASLLPDLLEEIANVVFSGGYWGRAGATIHWCLDIALRSGSYWKALEFMNYFIYFTFVQKSINFKIVTFRKDGIFFLPFSWRVYSPATKILSAEESWGCLPSYPSYVQLAHATGTLRSLAGKRASVRVSTPQCPIPVE